MTWGRRSLRLVRGLMSLCCFVLCESRWRRLGMINIMIFCMPRHATGTLYTRVFKLVPGIYSARVIVRVASTFIPPVLYRLRVA